MVKKYEVAVNLQQDFTQEEQMQGRVNIGAASASDVTALQSQVSSLSDVSAYSVKGEATVAQLNAGPSGIQAGWAYQLTDSGTLTDGSLAVVAGDTVAWDGTKWFPLVRSDYYATKTYAQNVAHSIAPEFMPNETNAVAGMPYIYGGKLYVAKEDYNGAWDSSKFFLKDAGQYVRDNSVIKIIPFNINYHFAISNRTNTLIFNGNYNTCVIPLSELGNYLAIENSDSTDSVKGVFTDSETFTDGAVITPVGDYIELKHGESIRLPVPKSKYLILYFYKTFVYENVKISSPAIDTTLSERYSYGEVKPSTVYPGKAISSSGGVVSVETSLPSIVSAVYDVSALDKVYVTLDANFSTQNYVVMLADDSNNLVKNVIKGELDSLTNRYITKARSYPVWCYKATKLYIMFTDVGSNGVGLNFVSKNPVLFSEKNLKLLPSTFKNGKLYYNGSFNDHWRCMADVYDVSNVGHVLMDYSFEGGFHSVVFLDAENNSTGMFESSRHTFYNRKIMVPVPSDAVSMVITSSLVKDENDKAVPYNRTKVYAIDYFKENLLTMDDALYAKRKSFDIFFIGNSLTQDAVSYVPFLLESEFPDVDFNIYVWYNGGFTLQDQWEDKIDPEVDAACQIFSAAHSGREWCNATNKKMSEILEYVRTDHLCLQEYFNYKESYTAEDCEYFNKIVDYVAGIMGHPVEVECLFHAPKRGPDFNTIYAMTKNGNITILKNTAANDIFIPGCTIYEGCHSALDSLGDNGHLSPDGTHAQEGLPCLLEAYTVMARILEKIGKATTIEGISSKVTASNYSSINVPGPNLGNGVVEGTDAEYDIAKKIASACMNKRIAILSETF